MKKQVLFLLIVIFFSSCAKVTPPEPLGPVPSGRQLAWHEMEYYMFVHFTVNTFTDKEWGYGDEKESVFNPTELDCNQWARVASEAGMKGIIITAKHHDGFCLWPSEYTEHSVKNSPWKDGKGDLIWDLRDSGIHNILPRPACRTAYKLWKYFRGMVRRSKWRRRLLRRSERGKEDR